MYRIGWHLIDMMWCANFNTVAAVWIVMILDPKEMLILNFYIE